MITPIAESVRVDCECDGAAADDRLILPGLPSLLRT